MITKIIIHDRTSSGKDITPSAGKRYHGRLPTHHHTKNAHDSDRKPAPLFPIVLITEKGTLKGLIVKADLIEKIV